LASAKSCWAPARSWDKLLCGVGSTRVVVAEELEGGELVVVELEPDLTGPVVVGPDLAGVVVVVVEGPPCAGGVVGVEASGPPEQ
jgi:hypothetical protein